MKNKKRAITDEKLDALLSGRPILPADSFVERTLIKASPIREDEIDSLLTGQLLHISPDFTERTLTIIEGNKTGILFEVPYMRWLIKSGMVAAVLLVGIFTYSIWQQQHTTLVSTQVAEANLAEMDLEELLYLEETLSSAKVLIELEKTVPLYYLIADADS
jgi:hypothetical protein